MQGKNNWIGKECEGRYHGLNTYFVRYKIDDNIPETTKHIYFTQEYVHSNNIDTIESFLGDFAVSIEVTKHNYKLITPNMKVWAHLIYRIEDEIPFDLKETDSIFIDKGTYNVLCFTKHQALKVNPIDYSNDIV